MLKTTKAVRGNHQRGSSGKPGGQRITETNRAVESVRSASAPCLSLGEELIAVITRLPALQRLGLNEKKLFFRADVHNFICLHATHEICKVLCHALVPCAEYLNDTRVIDKRVRLSAIDGKLRRVLPKRPEG